MREAGVPDSKLFVRPNFVRAPELPANRKTGNSYALFMGRLSPEKGCWTLIHAFEQLPHISLKIVGTGPMEQELRNYIRDKGIENVELLGFKSGDEKWQVLRNALLPGASVGVVREFSGDGARRIYGMQAGDCVPHGRLALHR